MIETNNTIEKSLGLYVYENMFAGLFIAVLQFVSALLTECLNLILITGQKATIDTVMNFVAFKVISEIDDIYASAMRDPVLLSLTEDDDAGSWMPKVVYGWVDFK